MEIQGKVADVLLLYVTKQPTPFLARRRSLKGNLILTQEQSYFYKALGWQLNSSALAGQCGTRQSASSLFQKLAPKDILHPTQYSSYFLG